MTSYSIFSTPNETFTMALALCTQWVVPLGEWPIPVQWATKLIHERSNFACESNCGSGNKDKSVGNCGNKGGYLVLCHAKYQTFIFVYWFYIDFRMRPGQWISFVAHLEIGPTHTYHMTKPQVSCDFISKVYIAFLGTISPPFNMSSITQQITMKLSQGGKCC